MSKNISKSKSKSKSSIKLNKNIDYGIYDPDGININPLTGTEYKNLYSHIKKNINGEVLNATYANLAKIWKTKLVYLHKDKILDSIKNNQVTLAKAGTGVGKTVLIPKIALHAFDYGEKVICTIPKKVITRSTAEFAAQCLDVKIGQEVGYYFRGENKTNENTKLIFTTTGSIISRITGSDPYLSEYKCIIIDEAHERSVQTDQLLLLLKKALAKRKDLKLVIMSATINLTVFRNYFPTPTFKFGEVDAGEFTSYEIQDHWLEKQPKPNEWKELAIKKIIHILQTSEDGDILVFIRASSDGKMLCDTLNKEATKLRKLKNVKINPFCVILAGNSSKEDENLATDETKYQELTGERGMKYTRKVVMATNVAESSLTVDGVVYVIDCGLEYEESYDPKTMARCLTEEPIAKSAVKQRRGRAGRTKPGVCYHLYTKSYFENLQDYPTPSIQKSDLTSDILDLMKLEYIKNVGDLKDFLNEFISPPKKMFINSSLKTLIALDAITSKENDGVITDLGYGIAKFRAIKTHLAKALISSYYYKCSQSVSDMIALMIVADGMINTIFPEFKPDKKKNKQYNDTKMKQFTKSRQLFTHPYGDTFSLLKAYTIFREKEAELKPKVIVGTNIIDTPKKSIIEYIKKSKTKSIVKSSPQRLQKSVKLLKSMKVDKSIIDEMKKSFKEKQMKTSKQLGGVSKKSSKKSIKSLKSILDKKETRLQKEEKTIKKWCVDHFINYRKMKQVKRMSQQIHMMLREVMRSVDLKKKKGFNKKSKKEKVELKKSTKISSKKQTGGRYSPLHKYFNFDIDYTMNIEDRICLSLLSGMFINIGKLKQRQIYESCFPPTKSEGKINMDSLLNVKPKLVFYDELFMFNKHSKILKLNICNQVPDHLYESIKELYKPIIKDCFTEKKMLSNRFDRFDSFANLRRGKKTKKKNKKQKKKRGYSKKRYDKKRRR